MALSDILYNEILRIRDKQLAEEERVLTAKILIKKTLLGFLNDWKSYSKSNQIYSNEDAEYLVFINEEKLNHHLNQFLLISNEISAVGILPDAVSDKLIDFASRMRVIADRSAIVSADAWSREYPSSLVNQFDNLLDDIVDMSTNLDEYCRTA
ncbi:hypothetical protein [Methanosarcina sp. DH2]|uniref:hypothetical protein n=1 Tax=Methanosarcina sp. DH2 TaxID=2605639 RepID=UPI001E493CA6|nr:hypothetical protein [Methanosarcina sp. DH2]